MTQLSLIVSGSFICADYKTRKWIVRVYVWIYFCAFWLWDKKFADFVSLWVLLVSSSSSTFGDIRVQFWFSVKSHVLSKEASNTTKLSCFEKLKKIHNLPVLPSSQDVQRAGLIFHKVTVEGVEVETYCSDHLQLFVSSSAPSHPAIFN